MESRARHGGRRHLLWNDGRLVQGGRRAQRPPPVEVQGRQRDHRQPISYRGPDGRQYIAVARRGRLVRRRRVAEARHARSAPRRSGSPMPPRTCLRKPRGRHALCLHASALALDNHRGGRARVRARATARNATVGRADRRAVPAGQSPDTIYPGSGRRPRSTHVRSSTTTTHRRSPKASALHANELRWLSLPWRRRDGPPLMDDEWRYGGRIDQTAATIAEGRPNGMPRGGAS